MRFATNMGTGAEPRCETVAWAGMAVGKGRGMSTATATASAHVERDAVIERPIDEVFARVSDVAHYDRWMSRRGIFRKSVQLDQDPVHQGTPYLDKGLMGTFHGDVAEFDSPRHILYREDLHLFGRSVMEARLSYDLGPVPGGTAVHNVADSTLFGVFRLMRPMVKLMGPGERRRTMDSLKRSLEDGAYEDQSDAS